ncbi:MAG: hypothetical protein ACK5IQ_02465 [Bacteroidales bacterium]
MAKRHFTEIAQGLAIAFSPIILSVAGESAYGLSISVNFGQGRY